MQENVRCETETKLALPLVFISLKNFPLPLHLSQIRRNALEVEWKFRFHAAKEYLDVWTRIWADIDQIRCLLLKMAVLMQKPGH